MATSSHAKTLIGGLGAEFKKALGEAFDYFLNNNIAFGPIDADTAQTKTTNMYGRFVKLVTNATANQEFSTAHGLGRTPNLFWPVGSPRVVNSRVLGDLVVSRAADPTRIYFTSASTNATGWIYVE